MQIVVLTRDGEELFDQPFQGQVAPKLFAFTRLPRAITINGIDTIMQETFGVCRLDYDETLRVRLRSGDDEIYVYREI